MLWRFNRSPDRRERRILRDASLGLSQHQMRDIGLEPTRTQPHHRSLMLW